MATADPMPVVAHIGATAGVVWKILSENGAMSLAKLVKATGEPRDTVMQALGWLAREDKITFDDGGRTRTVALR